LRRHANIRRVSANWFCYGVLERMARPKHIVRTTDADDYQSVPRPLAAMAKTFNGGTEIPPHHHLRDQFIYAVTGVMRVRTEKDAWIVPPDRAVYLPAGTQHAITMRGHVEMRTLYIVSKAHEGLPAAPAVLEVSPLLRELVLALIDEPVIYDEKGRGGSAAFLILLEIARARRLSLVIPMPHDPRLLRVCQSLLENPASTLTLESWADQAGASVRTLARLFEAELGMSFAVWRQRVRFHNALEAIIAGEPISRVAQRNGYRSSSAFSAAFRKAMGEAPSSLRVDGRPRDVA
jgi:AraC-like DNA-binding protein/quercetin dioxygenase-like cupin family protein